MKEPFKMDEIRDETRIEQSGVFMGKGFLSLLVAIIMVIAALYVSQSMIGGNSGPGNGDAKDAPIEILTDANFKDKVSSGLTLVDFWMYGCPPCDRMVPHIESVAKELEGDVIVAKININENPSTTESYGLQAFPTVILFENGNPVAENVGFMNRNQLLAMVESHKAKTSKAEKSPDAEPPTGPAPITDPPQNEGEKDSETL